MVRVCWISFSDFWTYGNDGRFGGAGASVLPHNMERIRGLNFTMTAETRVGDLTDPQNLLYDGCIGSIQRNESDVMLLPSFNFPSPGPNLVQGVVFAYHKVGIVSAYNRSSAGIVHGTHVLDLVFSFSPGLWVPTIVSHRPEPLSLKLHAGQRLEKEWQEEDDKMRHRIHPQTTLLGYS